jgi:DNA helicase-2/ATP-dependent DNA helicase PcrA
MYGGQQFYERNEVKDVIAYLRVALAPRDELALRRVLNYPARGIGATTVERLVSYAHAHRITLWEALVAPETGVTGPARAGIAAFRSAIERLAGALEAGHDPVAATRTLLDDIALYDDLRDAAPSASAAQRRIDNVEGLLGALGRANERAKGRDALADYLRKLALDRSDDDAHDSSDAIVLVTLHGAKGLEFPVCFMIGLEEELLPHARTLNPQVTDVSDSEHAVDISEERRLCYVGITRAQRKLYLTRACTRVSRGRIAQRTPSRFLLEIPDELLEVRDLADEARQQVPAEEVRSFFASFGFEE